MIEAKQNKMLALSTMALVVAGVISKFLGAIYRIPLTNILGAEGIGMYQMIFPIYALMITFSSGGIPTAIARLVAEKRALSDSNGVVGIVKTSSTMLALLGAFFMLLMGLLAMPLARLQGNGDLTIPYLTLAPAVLLVAISSVLKGYFQGCINLAPTVVSGLIEQVVKMALGLMLSSLLMHYGIVYAVCGAMLGVVGAELVSMVVLFVLYHKSKDAKIDMHIDSITNYRKDIFKVAIPIAISSIIFPLSQFIDSLMVVNILKGTGIGQARATELYGILTGPVGTLINMPVVIVIAICIMLIPTISSSRVKHDAKVVKEKCRMAIKVSYLIGVPAFFGMFVLSDVIMKVLYPSLGVDNLRLGAMLLRVSSISIVLLCEVQIYTTLLEALDKTGVAMRALFLSLIVKVVLGYLLIRFYSILGMAIASILTYLVIVVMDSIYMKRYLGYSKQLFDSIAKILISGLLMAGGVLLATMFIRNIYLSLFVGLCVGVALYIIFMVLLNVMNEKELLALPFGKLLVYFNRKLRFWERADDKNNRTRSS